MYVQSVQEAVVLTRLLCTVNKSTGEVRPAPPHTHARTLEVRPAPASHTHSRATRKRWADSDGS